MLSDEYRGFDVEPICYSCKSEYGSNDCIYCVHYDIRLGTQDKYKPLDCVRPMIDLEHKKYDTTNSNIPEDIETIELDIPEGVKHITINFKQNNNQQNTTHYSHIPEESDVGYDTYSCDNCGHHYCVDEGFDIPNYCENCGYRIEV